MSTGDQVLDPNATEFVFTGAPVGESANTRGSSNTSCTGAANDLLSSSSSRQCSQCNQSRCREDYSSNQWKKGLAGRCKRCVGSKGRSRRQPGGGRGRNSGARGRSISSRSGIDELLEIDETMEELRKRIKGPSWPRTSESVEKINLKIRHLEMLRSGAKHDDDTLGYLRASKLLGGFKDELERIEEELRVQKVVQEWREIRVSSNRNFDNENTECPFCSDFIALDATTRGPDGELIYQGRLFCCGARICLDCKKKMAKPKDWVDAAFFICPVCTKPPGGHFRSIHPNTMPHCAWLQYAKEGKAWAQVVVARHYLQGTTEVDQDSQKALEWYHLAAKKGDPSAYFDIATMHMGLFDGVARSPDQTRKYMALAAEAGDSAGQLMAGNLFSTEDYGAVDLQKALRYYCLAAAQGNAEAQCILGEYIMDRHIKSKYPTHRAIYWFQKAAKLGLKRAQYRLSEALLTRGYELYDYITAPSYSPMPLAIYWARQAVSGDGTKKEWQVHLDMLLDAANEECAMTGVCDDCDGTTSIECKVCRAAYYCSLHCQKEHHKLGHDEDCRVCVVFDPEVEVVVKGLVSAAHWNGKVGTILNYNSEKGRYGVMMQDGKKEILVKSENIALPYQPMSFSDLETID